MFNQLRFGYSFGIALVASSLLGPLAMAQVPTPDEAVTRAAGEAALQWGACPSFLPEGCGIAVLHGDPAKDNADVFFKVPGKSTLPLHWHTSAERMVLVAGKLELTYEGQAQVTLEPGHYAYGPAKLPHSGTCVSAEPCILFIAFESPVDAVPGAMSAE
jgi:quercetin dioxygenase-like cupin family protein